MRLCPDVYSLLSNGETQVANKLSFQLVQSLFANLYALVLAVTLQTHFIKGVRKEERVQSNRKMISKITLQNMKVFEYKN